MWLRRTHCRLFIAVIPRTFYACWIVIPPVIEAEHDIVNLLQSCAELQHECVLRARLCAINTRANTTAPRTPGLDSFQMWPSIAFCLFSPRHAKPCKLEFPKYPRFVLELQSCWAPELPSEHTCARPPVAKELFVERARYQSRSIFSWQEGRLGAGVGGELSQS
jgi:hypothetical protein